MGGEFRDKRMELGLSQQRVADAARMARSTYSRVERGKRPSLTLLAATRVAAVLGLELAIKCYPGGDPIRDAASAAKIKIVCGKIGPPLRWQTEVALPQHGQWREQRRWDLVLTGHGKRTAMEFEQRLQDVQAQHGRWNLKRRDDQIDSFVLAVADTHANRTVLRLYADLFADLPRLRTATVLAMLRAGEHPPTGLILL